MIRTCVAFQFVTVLTLCAFGASEAQAGWVQYFPDGLSGNSWYSRVLDGMNEPSLFERKADPRAMAYRFLWLRSSHDWIAVRLEETPTGAKGRVVRSRHGNDNPWGSVVEERDFVISPGEWKTLEDKLSWTGFWGMSSPHSNLDIGLGGSQWVVEGIRDGHYHVVDCWTPPLDSKERHLEAFVELGKFFLEVANVSVSRKEFY